MDNMTADTYFLDIAPYAYKGMVSDVALAFALQHGEGDGDTLMTTTVDGVEYDLRIVGGYTLNTENGSIYSTSGFSEYTANELVIDAAVIGGDASFTPWFEWINEDGDAMGDIFDEISVVPSIEVAKLHALLQSEDQNIDDKSDFYVTATYSTTISVAADSLEQAEQYVRAFSDKEVRDNLIDNLSAGFGDADLESVYGDSDLDDDNSPR